MQHIKGRVFKEFHLISRLSKMHMRRGFERSGLEKIGHPYILNVLAESGNDGHIDTQQELSKVLKITPAAIAQAIKLMDREGLLQKISDEKDLRVNKIAITDKGREYVKKMNSGMGYLAEAFFANFTEEEMEQIHQFNQRLIENLKNFENETASIEEKKH
ncbi:MAG: winged helix DNA-binding protein [Anaerolineaceae bacterium]|nr:winged helix DNA-binding protein [Anaerolineaceae bacterium]